MEDKKRPPVSISKLGMKEGVEEPKPGKLSYIGEEKKRPSSSDSRFKNINFSQVVLSACISLVLILIIATTMSASKKDAMVLLDNQKELDSKIASLEGGFSTESNRLGNVINSMGEYAKKTELNGFASKDSIASLSGLSAQVDSKLAGFEASYDEELAAHITRIVALEARIVELENGGTTTAGSLSGEVYVDLKYITYLTFPKEGSFPEGDETFTRSLVFDIVNDSSKTIQDIEIQLILRPAYSVPFTFSLGALSGYPLQWTRVPVDGLLVFIGTTSTPWGNLEIPSGEKETIYSILTLEVEDAKASEVLLDIGVEVKEYEIVK